MCPGPVAPGPLILRLLQSPSHPALSPDVRHGPAAVLPQAPWRCLAVVLHDGPGRCGISCGSGTKGNTLISLLDKAAQRDLTLQTFRCQLNPIF